MTRPAQVGGFTAGEIVVASLPAGECYARVVGHTVNRKGFVVDIGGAHVVAFSARSAPKAVQP